MSTGNLDKSVQKWLNEAKKTKDSDRLRQIANALEQLSAYEAAAKVRRMQISAQNKEIWR